MKPKRKKWKMPKWMVPYDRYLAGGGRAEEFMNCDGVNCDVAVNAPRALICYGVQTMVGLLERMRDEGRLK